MPCRWLGGACGGGRLGVEGRGGAGGGAGAITRDQNATAPYLRPIISRSSATNLLPRIPSASISTARQHATASRLVADDRHGTPTRNSQLALRWCAISHGVLCPCYAPLVLLWCAERGGGGGTTGQTRRVNYQHVGAHLAHGARRDHGRWEEAGRKRGGSGRSNRAHEMLCTCA